jgi:thiol:disulfide interchange protein DsbD
MDSAADPLNRYARAAAALCCAGFCASAAATDAAALWPHKNAANTELLPVDQAFALVSAERKHGTVEVSWSIAPGYYLYRKRLGFESEPAAQALGAAQLPAGARLHDEQGDNEIYRSDLVAVLPIRANAAAPQRLRVRYQGCADAGVCYPPQTRLIDIVSPAAQP